MRNFDSLDSLDDRATMKIEELMTPRREGHEQVVSVTVQSSNEASCTLDPGGHQRRLVGSISFNDQPALFARAGGGFLVLVNHHERSVLVGQSPRDDRTDPSPSRR